MDILLIISLGLLIGCLLGLSWFAGTDAPYVATKKIRIRKILKVANLQKGDIFYELGSGDGRVVTEAAKMGANSFGIEQSLIRILYSRFKAFRLNLHNTHFIHGDIFKENLSSANLVFIFLLPKGILKLEPKLKRELKKGSIVITQTFHFKNWKPYKKILVTANNQPNTLLGEKKYEGDFWIYKK